ncbi:MAG: flagellar hook-associated protein FlgL [Rhodocyclaceae bacterium]|nr:flagellar hook-associated protein FlgL [Rhodocyclaceae bacterium]
MRLSTSMIFDGAMSNMQSQTSALQHTQQQIATGRRMITPSDDPAAAAQALELNQAKAINSQYASNQGSAKGTLSLVDGQLSAVNDLVQYVQSRAIQANNAALNPSDLKAIATDVQSQFQQLMGLANGTDGLGQFLFSGNKGSTQPFSGDVLAGSATGAAVSYAGDSGSRALQVSSSRQLPVNVSGDSLFMGNPYANITASSGNTGTYSPLTSSVDVNGALTGHDYQIKLTDTGAYQVIDNTKPAASNVITFGTVTTGATSTIQFDGVSVQITSSALPTAGNTDTFDIKTGKPGLFDTLSNLVNTLQNAATAGVGGGAPAAHSSFQTQLTAAEGSLSTALDSILNARASVGSRLSELDGLSTVNANLDTQYAQVLSSLQDTDYNKAISQLSMQQIGLQAAQKSFIQVSGLSLFDFMK